MDNINLSWIIYFTTINISISIYIIYLFKIKAYKAIFFGEKTLSDLPSYPIIAINATNLSTGTLWTFSKNKSSDSSYEFPKDGGNSIKFECGEFPQQLLSPVVQVFQFPSIQLLYLQNILKILKIIVE